MYALSTITNLYLKYNLFFYRKLERKKLALDHYLTECKMSFIVQVQFFFSSRLSVQFQKETYINVVLRYRLTSKNSLAANLRQPLKFIT